MGKTCSDTTFWLSGPVCPQFLPKNLHLVWCGHARAWGHHPLLTGWPVHRWASQEDTPGKQGGSTKTAQVGLAHCCILKSGRTVNMGSCFRTHICKQMAAAEWASSASCRGPGVIADFFQRIIAVSGEIQSHFLNSSKREFRNSSRPFIFLGVAFLVTSCLMTAQHVCQLWGWGGWSFHFVLI